jgi:LuxR family maltose regulon positive regulatory protein
VTALVEDAPELVPLLRRAAGAFPDAYLAGVVEQAERSHPGADAARPDPALDALSGREREILTYLPSHRSQGQIAAEMYVSINTVKTHIRAVYRKLGVASRSEAVSVARAQKLI